MICALMLGRKGSVGFPGKNLYPVLGRPLMVYPLLGAKHSKFVDKIYISTDDEQIMEIGRQHGAEIIVRPPELASKTALGEHAYLHGYKVISEKLKEKPELLALLHCNGATLLASTIDRGVEVLRQNPAIDSAVTASAYNMWSPMRARREDSEGLLKPFVPFETFGDPKEINCDRDSMGDVWFADMALSLVRSRCMDHMDDGLLPQKWMGKKIYPLKQWGGLDVDFEWQIPQVEFWLRKNGFSKSKTPYGAGSIK
ncbi:MAG: cytidylyltransferase [Omnitrophica bacterium RIFOXYB12_FULL_50_7]|nr:MAG: cytidylyltransferase [Omnitrophica bacterium RIFOXYB12_FULL_50_7]